MRRLAAGLALDFRIGYVERRRPIGEGCNTGAFTVVVVISSMHILVLQPRWCLLVGSTTASVVSLTNELEPLIPLIHSCETDRPHNY